MINFANAFMEPWGDKVQIYLADKKANGDIAVCDGLVMRLHENPEDKVIDSVPVNFSKAASIRLMDALWNCGIRPSKEAESVGHLSSVQKHLEDMRQIAFKKLSVDKP